jgi:tetratricopeptide (TPR) repeat protein
MATLSSEQQPRKRARILGREAIGNSNSRNDTSSSNVDSEITLLNDYGVATMKNGHIDDAQHFFVQALDCFIAKQQGIELPPTLLSSLPQQKSSDFALASAVSLCSENVSASPTCCPNNSFKAKTLAPVSSTNDEKNSERNEYDEGIHPCTESMTLAVSSDECAPNQPSPATYSAVQSATLYFNVAQTFVRLEKYEQAACWFKLAVICSNFTNMTPTLATMLLRTYHNLGYCCYRLGQADEAVLCFEKTLALAPDSNLPMLYSATVHNCLAVMYFHDPAISNEQAIGFFHTSLSEYKQVCGEESQEYATVLNNLGRAIYATGNFAEALTVYESALAIRRKVLPSDAVDVAATICSAGQTSHRLGAFEGAVRYYKEFLALTENGKYNNSDIAIITKNLAEIVHRQGDLQQAKQRYECALTAARKGFGDFHPEVASILNRLGNWYYESEQLESALKCYSEGLQIEQMTLPSISSRIIVTMTNIAQIHFKLENYAAALIKYNQVYALQLEVHGPTSLHVAKAMSTMGEMEYKVKNYEASFALFQDVLLIQRVHIEEGQEDGVEIASTLNSIGIVAFAQREFFIARECFASSLEIRKKHLGIDHKDTATLWYNLATTYEEIGDEDVAEDMYRETLRIERLCSDGPSDDAIDTLQRLGRLYQSRGDLDEGLQHYKEALATLRAKSGTQLAFAVGKFLNLIGNIHLQRAEIAEMMECYAEASRIYRETDALSSRPSEVLVIAGYYLYGLARMHPPCASVA